MAHDLLTLITVLEEDRVLDDHKKAVVESLLEKVTSLKNLMEKSTMQLQRQLESKKEIIQELQSEIRDAAREAQDIIESRAVDQMLSEESDSSRSVISSPDHSIMIEVMKKFDAANGKMMKIIKEDYHHQSHDQGDMTSGDAISNPSFAVASDPKNALMVGFEEDALRLKHRLTSQRSAREIIPIVGMGGIGKTTLARNLYMDPLILSHFDIRAWVTISQDYNMQAVLLGLLGSVSQNNYDHMDCSMLGDTMYHMLYGKRYLVVLDDVWNEKAWDEIQRYVPKENHRSRIVITSRELHVAKHPDSACEEHQMHLLSGDQGWDFLRQKVFEKDEHCPPFLEEIGRRIVSGCKGLPLALSVIGGLLSVEKHSRDLWDRVAKDVRSITDSHISEILCLSYDNLPLHLKPCFLYMSAFPEDFQVRGSKLVKLFVSEGFLPRKNNKSLEDVAGECLKALVDRNLLSVIHTKSNVRAGTYSMHDLLRDLCVRKAEDEKFLHICESVNANSCRRVSVHQITKDAPDMLVEDLSCSRSLLFISPPHFSINISSALSSLRLVRVLDVSELRFDEFPIEILKLANLRFLAICLYGSLPNKICRLRNLQTLWLFRRDDSQVILPYGAWDIPGLRHIVLKISLTTIHIDCRIPRVLKNLQTISSVLLLDLLTSNLINNIPTIKKLGISGGGFVSEHRIIDLSHMDKLETLILKEFSVSVLSLLTLPDCLKRLSLYDCSLSTGFVNVVSDLQHLEMLKIDFCAFEEEDGEEEDDNEEEEEEEEEEEKEEWELSEGVEFSSLQFLELRDLSMVRWKADDSHFPRLRHLKIQLCDDLKEIPASIGEISTLEVIEVDKDNSGHVDWANEVRKIQQNEYGNESLQIRLL